MSAPTPPRGPEGDEWVEADDRRIGTAFRRSLRVIGAVAVVAAGLFALNQRKPAPPPVSEAKTAAPQAQPRADLPVPQARFTDVTKAWGIDFVHHNGATGEKLLPETMGGGVAVIDVDGDGRPDLVFVDSGKWPWTAGAPTGPTLRLYHNDGGGKFHETTAGSGLDGVHLYGMGIAVGDFDNDGRDDLVVTGVGDLRLLHNAGGGKFKDVTAQAGLRAAKDDWNTCAAFVDVDNDGRLDLVVCRYVRWTRELDRANDFRMTGIGRAYGPPNTFEGSAVRLFHNDGAGRFTDVSDKAGLRVTGTTGKPVAKSLGILPMDVNGDGFVDLVIANDTVRNFLFVNRGDGTFKEAGAESGVAYDQNGNARGAMGIDAAFYRNNDALAIAIGNFANEMSALYVGDGRALRFSDEAMVEGIGPPTRLFLTFGVLFFDVDLDGRADLFHANGHLEAQINKVQSSQQYAQPAQVFWNCGAACPQAFVEVPRDTLGDLAAPMVGRGAVYADLDGDGDLDLVITQIGGPPKVLRNDQASGHHWLRVALVGGGKVNRNAIGSVVEVTAGGVTQRQVVMPARGYLSSVERTLTFGLGTADKVERMRVRWTDGTTQDVDVANVDQVIRVGHAR